MNGRLKTKNKYFTYDDGGRKVAGFKGDTGDCATRSIAIVTERPYKEIYDLINVSTKSKCGKSLARTGVPKKVMTQILESMGWEWIPTMKIGQGCRVHLRADELPKGRIIARVSKHVVAVIDGVIRDTHDCSRSGKRCIYGYYQKSNLQR